jgi:hypothetical protein
MGIRPFIIHINLGGFLKFSLQHHFFLDGFVQHKKRLVILRINIINVHSSSEPSLFWLKFQRLVI